MVLCYGAVFFLVVRFVAFILFPQTVYLKSFWGPLGVILVSCGIILVALGASRDPRGTPGGPPAVQSGFSIDLGRFRPPPWGPNFGTFLIKSPKSRAPEAQFCKARGQHRFFDKIDEK